MPISADALYQALKQDLAPVIDTTLPGWAPDSTPIQVQAYCLKESLVKKFMKDDKPSASACLAAREKFLRVNTRCADWSYAPVTSWDEEIMGGIKQAIHEFYFAKEQPILGDYLEIFSRGKAGPGASINARGEDFYTKVFDSPLSHTGQLHDLWTRCTNLSASWSEAEDARATCHGFTATEISQYSFVNKNVTVARGICTEPTINMWFQLGAGKLITERLSHHWGICIEKTDASTVEYNRCTKSLSAQPERAPQHEANRVLARVGSSTGRLATLDLESASDSISLKMLRWLLPRTFLSVLETLRCSSTQLPTGEVVGLNMVSTMGNGYTFPLQTMIFTAVVVAVYRYFGIPFVSRGPVESRTLGVFGDDIIVDTSVQRHVVRALELLGFVVNRDKSFVEGPFRESCGADFFNGIPVRGVYIQKLRTLQDLFSAINRLNRWTARTGICLPNLVGLLLGEIRNPSRFIVPFDEGDDAGIHAPPEYGCGRNALNRIGQRSYRAHVPVQWSFIIIGGSCWTYKSQKRRRLNPMGTLIASVQGCIRGYCVMLRQSVTQYTTKRKMTPRWGYFPPRPLENLFGDSGYRSVVASCDRNLLGTGLFG